MSHSYNHHEAARPTTNTNSPSPPYQEQPGLEVAPDLDTTGLHHDYYTEDTAKQTVAPGDRGGYYPDEHHASPGLQAGAPPVAEAKYDNGGGGGLHPAAGGAAYSPAENDATAAAPGKKPSRKRLWIILGVIAAILVIIGAVLGGVLGTRASNTGNSSDSSSSPGDGDTAAGNQGNDTAPPATPLKSVRPGSRLAVTGWREGAGYHIRLFYQGPDQRLRYSTFASTEPDGWDAHPTLLDQLEYPAADNTSLAAATSVESKEVMGEDKLFYLDKNNTVRLQLFRKDIRAAGNRGALNDYPAQVAPGSRLAAYWPSLLSEEPGSGATSGKLRWTRYWGRNADKNHDFWEHEDANITASPGSGLAVVPASSKYGGAGGFIFRRGDGKVFNSLGDHYDGGFNGTAWDKGDLANNLNGLQIPGASPLAAFTVARSGANPQNFVNTYILYVGGLGNVNMLWQDDEASGWKGPSQYPAAFGGADPGTDLTCLTPAAWAGTDVEVTGAYDMSRCYFQAGGGGCARCDEME
ncbi:hypothetical protein PG991_001697 [Apiospora marii]|uniref:Fucose-specific lectin n=1 Tax=Apiospora marii TaxID=335849 RepID=A0ABR1SS49_9PEZI